MANSNIVGVKYIGGKTQKEDNVAGTGAVWVPGQIINFTQDVASKLIYHKDVWELTSANPNGETYLGSKKNPALAIEPMPFININEMDAGSLVAYARVEFNRVLDAGADIEALRKEVHGLMVNQTLDEIHDTKEKPAFYSISLQVTEVERDAFLAGELILRLVPKLDTGSAVPEQVNSQANTAQDEPPASQDEVGETNTASNESESQTEEAPAEPTQEAAQDEPLEVTLSKLDKKALREMCKDFGIPVANTMTEEVLRDKLLAKAGVK